MVSAGPINAVFWNVLMLLSQVVHDFTAWQNLFGHLVYILAIASMIMRSMTWLRSIAILSGISGVIYFGIIRGDYVSAFWECSYISVNIIQLFILWFENRASQFDEDERQFVHDALMDLKPVHAAKMLRIGAVETVGEGQQLLEQGETPERLYYLLSGEVRIVQDGQQVGACHRGDFLGEMSFVSGSVAHATALAAGPCRVLVFERSRLAELLARREPLRHALHAGVSRNLLTKLNRMNAHSVLRQNRLAGA